MKKSYFTILVFLIAIIGISAVSAGLFGMGEDSSNSSNPTSNYTAHYDTAWDELADAKIVSSNLTTKVYKHGGILCADTSGTITLKIDDNNNHLADSVESEGIKKIICNGDDESIFISESDVESCDVSGNQITFKINNTGEKYVGNHPDGVHAFDLKELQVCFKDTSDNVTYSFIASK